VYVVNAIQVEVVGVVPADRAGLNPQHRNLYVYKNFKSRSEV